MLLYKKYPEIDITGIVDQVRHYMETYTDFLSFSETPQYYIDYNHFTKEIPDFLPFFKNLGLTPTLIGAVVIHEHCMPIHCDRGVGDSTIKINLPIFNCEKSNTVFFKMLPGFESVVNRRPPPIDPKLDDPVPYIIPGNQCVAIDRFTLDCLTVLNVAVPHRVVNLSPIRPRISLTMLFEENLESWLAEDA